MCSNHIFATNKTISNMVLFFPILLDYNKKLKSLTSEITEPRDFFYALRRARGFGLTMQPKDFITVFVIYFFVEFFTFAPRFLPRTKGTCQFPFLFVRERRHWKHLQKIVYINYNTKIKRKQN